MRKDGHQRLNSQGSKWADSDYFDAVIQASANAKLCGLDGSIKVVVEVEYGSAVTVVRILSQNHPNPALEITTAAL